MRPRPAEPAPPVHKLLVPAVATAPNNPFNQIDNRTSRGNLRPDQGRRLPHL